MKKLGLSTLLFFTTMVLVAQVGIGTANPDGSAVLELKSTTKGFLPPRVADETTIATPATGLVIYNTTLNCLQVNIGTPTVPDWQCMDGGVAPAGTIASLDNCATPTMSGTVTENTAATGASFTINYSGGNGAAFTGEAVAATGVAGTLEATLADGTFATGAGSVTYNLTGTPTASGTASFAISVGGQTCTVSVAVAAAGPPKDTTTTIVDVPGQNGTVWMDRNLGATMASNQPRSAFATDSQYTASQGNSFGDLYQWGRAADGHQSRTSTTASGPVASGSEGDKFIIDTSIDWLSTQDDTRWQAGNNDPCPTGYRIPTDTELNNELLAFATQNRSGAFGSSLKLPAAGYRDYTNTLERVGSDGAYWSSTVYSIASRILFFDNSDSFVHHFARVNGLSVRCIKE